MVCAQSDPRPPLKPPLGDITSMGLIKQFDQYHADYRYTYVLPLVGFILQL